MAIDLESHHASPEIPPDEEMHGLVFLRDEGLGLLASFRSIRDDDTRRAIETLVRAIAKSQSKVDGG